jgi:hypothetical protein
MEEKNNGLIHDKTGSVSSKRVIGIASFTVAVLLMVTAIAFAPFNPLITTTAMQGLKMFLAFSAGLLGVGVAEHFIKK